jgi:hypothetical protein
VLELPNPKKKTPPQDPMNEEIQIFPPPIFDNNTQLSLLLTSDHEQKILSTDFIFAVDPYDLGPRGKKKGKGGGFGYMGIAPSPRPSPVTIRVCLIIMVIPTLLC